MPNKKNLDQIKILQEKLKKAKSVVVIDYSGTNVNDQVKLRSDLREAGGEMFVTKNTLIDIAFGKGKLTDSLKGMSAVVFSYQDAVSALKKLFAFHKDTEKLIIKQGLMDDKVLSIKEIEALSELPNMNELIATLINLIQSPTHGLVNVFQASQRDLVGVLKSIADKKRIV